MRRAAPADQIDAMDALAALRLAEVPMLLVHDENGHFDGLVTPPSTVSAIAGEDVRVDQDIGNEPFVVEPRMPPSLLIARMNTADPIGDDKDRTRRRPRL